MGSYIPETREQTRNLIMDYIIAHTTGRRIDAMDVTRGIRDRYGIRIDWRPVSDVLERMAQDGQITRDGCTFDRMAAYTIL